MFHNKPDLLKVLLIYCSLQLVMEHTVYVGPMDSPRNLSATRIEPGNEGGRNEGRWKKSKGPNLVLYVCMAVTDALERAGKHCMCTRETGRHAYRDMMRHSKGLD